MTGSISWRLPLLLQMVPAVVLLVALVVFFPFSPRWLAAQTSPERQAEGRRVLSHLRGKAVDSDEVQDECILCLLTMAFRSPADDDRPCRNCRWAEILLEARFAAELKAERRGKAVGLWADLKADMYEWAELFEPGVRKRTLVGCGVCILQQMSGINALLYYGPMLLEALGLSGDSAVLLGSGMINIIQVRIALSSLLQQGQSLTRRPPP